MSTKTSSKTSPSSNAASFREEMLAGVLRAAIKPGETYQHLLAIANLAENPEQLWQEVATLAAAARRVRLPTYQELVKHQEDGVL